MSFMVQFGGSFLIVMPKEGSRVPEFGCYVLLAWCMWHPFMYRQQTNWEFVLETCTIMGGLLVLLSAMQTSAHDARQLATVGKLPVKAPTEGGGASADATPSMLKAAHRNQATGRVLITSVFIFYAFQKVCVYVLRLTPRGPNPTPTSSGYTKPVPTSHSPLTTPVPPPPRSTATPSGYSSAQRTTTGSPQSGRPSSSSAVSTCAPSSSSA
jgi:hypothetical protein